MSLKSLFSILKGGVGSGNKDHKEHPDTRGDSSSEIVLKKDKKK